MKAPPANAVFGKTLSDTQVRSLAVTNANYASGLQDLDFLIAANPYMAYLVPIMAAQHVNSPSALNANNAYMVNKVSKAVTAITIPQLATALNQSSSVFTAHPESYLTNLGLEYWFDPASRASTYIVGNSLISAKCAPDYAFVVPVGGCAVAQLGVFTNARNSVTAFEDFNAGWLTATSLQSSDVLNVGPYNYYWDSLNFFFSTDDYFVLAVYVYGTPY